MSFHKVIGIDLGTTYSAVSIWDGRKIHVIESPFGAKTVPSVVSLDPAGQVIVGTPAQNNLVIEPDNTVIEIKREMGVYERPPRDAGDPGVPKRVRFRNHDYLPQEISAFILKALKEQAERYIGEPIHDAVITVPAYFKEPQRGATKDAANIARLNVRRLLNEPTAAAVCYGADRAEDDRIHTYAVYDLGGGTFDVSIIQVGPGNVSVVGTGGDPRLGGGDFDDLIVDYALEQISRQHGVDLRREPQIRQRIKREAEVRKRELSVAAAATLNLPFLTATVSTNIVITRETFERLIKDSLERSVRCLDEAIASAHESNGIERDEIEQVLLVGGSTRIACVPGMLAEYFDLDLKDIRSDISPDEVVARGAGLVAREFAPTDRYEGPDAPPDDRPAESTVLAGSPGLELQDVTSHTLGIWANEADFIPILPKDSRIPGTATRDNFTNAEAYTSVDVLIFQGEEQIAFDNTLIGRVPIELPEPRERGYWQFAVTFSLDQNGLLEVVVRCLNDGQLWRTDLQCNVRASAQSLARATENIDRVMARPAGETAPGKSNGAGTGWDGSATAGNGTDPDRPAVRLPKPPVPAPAEPPAREPGPPPADTPPEFKMVARRSYKLVGQLEPGPDLDLLRTAYLDFVDAVDTSSDEMEALGDALYDAFHEVKTKHRES